MTYERLTAADTVFLRIETAHEPQHVGSLSVIEGAPLRDASGRVRFDELKAHIARRLHQVPRLRQRVMEVPYAQARPVWVDDEHFDIDYHVRLTALPAGHVLGSAQIVIESGGTRIVASGVQDRFDYAFTVVPALKTAAKSKTLSTKAVSKKKPAAKTTA